MFCAPPLKFQVNGPLDYFKHLLAYAEQPCVSVPHGRFRSQAHRRRVFIRLPQPIPAVIAD
jgi:hypothetical protein